MKPVYVNLNNDKKYCFKINKKRIINNKKPPKFEVGDGVEIVK